MVYIVALIKLTIILIYFFYNIPIALLICAKISTTYFNFSNIFFFDFVIELLEYTKINNYLINLLNDK